jgi:hypothetical protein
MPRRALGERAMTPTERSAKRRHSQTDEIRLLRHALLDAMAVFDIGQRGSTKFHKAYAGVIARAVAAGQTGAARRG